MDLTHQTVFTVLSHDPRTQTFSTLLSHVPYIVQKLNQPSTDWTVWAPCEEAWNDKHTVPPDDILKALISRLITPISLSSSDLSLFPNVPLLDTPPHLNGRHQLLRTRPVFLPHIGPTFSLNFSSAHVIVPDIVAKNGTIHILDAVPRAPRPLVEMVVQDLPSAAFGMLHRAIALCPDFETELRALTRGATFFAPTNSAFAAAGMREEDDLAGFLPPERLRDLLRNHLCPDRTLYSNVFYPATTPAAMEGDDNIAAQWRGRRVPFLKGERNFSLPTARPGREVTVVVHRYGGLIHLDVNPPRAVVISADHVAGNGVVHVTNRLVVEVEETSA